jgi:ParB/RepB/Spo0J family partition protein
VSEVPPSLGIGGRVSQVICTSEIRPAPGNRMHGGIGDLTDLVNSIKVHGLIEPIVVREIATTAEGHRYELVAGERRWRAMDKLAHSGIEAVIRKLSDEEALEVRVIENTQRENLHPLDEAHDFGELIDRGQDVTAIARKTGRPPAYVAQRLKLLTLSKACKTALDDQRIALPVALLLARIPDAKLQDEALEQVAGDEWEKPKSAANAAKLIEEEYMLRLEAAPFDITDPTLVAKAGACNGCPKRTGNQAVLFADVASPDLCIDPKCYRSKLDALWKVRRSKGDLEMLEGKDAEKALGYGGGYEKLDATTWTSSGKQTTIRKQLGKELPPIVVAQDPHTGAHIELVRRSDADKVLAAKRRDKSRGDDEGEVGPAYDAAAEQRKRDAKDKRRRLAVNAAIAEVVKKVGKAKPTVLLDLFTVALVHGSQHEARSATCKRRGLLKKEPAGARGLDVEELLSKACEAASEHERWSIGIELAVRRSAPSTWNSGGELWQLALKSFAIDYKAIEKQVAAEQRAKSNGKKKEKKPPRAPAKSSGAGVCRECGCTDEAACPGGCAWVEPDLCSSCAPDGAVMGKNGKKSPAANPRKRKAKSTGKRVSGKKSSVSTTAQ